MPAPIVPLLIGAAVIGGAMLLGKRGAASPAPTPKKPLTPPGTVPFPVPGVPGPGGYTAPPLIPDAPAVPGWPPTWWPGKETGAPPPLPPLPGTFPGGGTTGPIPGTTTGPTTTAPDDGVAGLPEPLKTTTIMAMSTAAGPEGANSLDGLALELDRIGQHKAAYEVRARSNEVRKGTSSSAAPTLGAEDYGIYTDKNSAKWMIRNTTIGWTAASDDYLPATGSLWAASYEALLAQIEGFASTSTKTSVSGGNLGNPSLQYPGFVMYPDGYPAGPETYPPHVGASNLGDPSLQYPGSVTYPDGYPAGPETYPPHVGAMAIPFAATMRRHADPTAPMAPLGLYPMPPIGSDHYKAMEFGRLRGYSDYCAGRPYYPNGAVVASDVFKDGPKLGWPKHVIAMVAHYVRIGYEAGYRAARDEGCSPKYPGFVPQVPKAAAPAAQYASAAYMQMQPQMQMQQPQMFYRRR